MAVEFLEAKHGGAEQLKTWTNTFLAETWEEQGDKVELSSVAERCETYGPDRLPNGVVLVVAGADVQKDRIELEWLGVGADDETWGIEVVKTYGDTENPETWQRFGSSLAKVFKRDDGIELHPTAVAIDFHYKPATVKGWMNTSGVKCLLVPVIGIGAEQPSLTYRRMGQDKFPHWTIATNQAKDILFQRLRISERGPRFCHFPVGFGYDDDWFRQLTSERAITKYTRGFPKRVYEKSAGARNEALDMRVYSIACLDILRPQYSKIADSLKKEKPAEAPGRVSRYRGGWVKGWK